MFKNVLKITLLFSAILGTQNLIPSAPPAPTETPAAGSAFLSIDDLMANHLKGRAGLKEKIKQPEVRADVERLKRLMEKIRNIETLLALDCLEKITIIESELEEEDNDTVIAEKSAKIGALIEEGKRTSFMFRSKTFEIFTDWLMLIGFNKKVREYLAAGALLEIDTHIEENEQLLEAILRIGGKALLNAQTLEKKLETATDFEATVLSMLTLTVSINGQLPIMATLIKDPKASAETRGLGISKSLLITIAISEDHETKFMLQSIGKSHPHLHRYISTQIEAFNTLKGDAIKIAE
ncbi:hypothetical protein HN446_00885 [bacterium]|mgnify:CR=1 FL=1|nr:hypothetical protein [bacterium]